MSYQNKPGSGAIFKNDKKTKENQPDYKGTFNCDGDDFEIALWVKEGKKGKFFSAKVNVKNPSGPNPLPTIKPIDEENLPF